MKHIAYILYISIVAAVVSACSKEDTGSPDDMPNITFGVSGLDISTKGLITNGSFVSGEVYVYGVKNNTEPLYNNDALSKSPEGNNWTPTDNKKIKQWATGSYSFYGYTKSPTGNPGNGASCTIANNSGAMKITVSQPSSYSEPDMVDYMLSHAYKVADGTNYRTVMLYMEHAMAWVEVFVEKEEENHIIVLKNITLSNIYKSATMQCESQAIANSGDKNIWTVQLQGENNVVYSTSVFPRPTNAAFPLPDKYAELEAHERNKHFLGSLNILAIPQQLTAKATLSVTYTVDEDNNNNTDPTEYTQVFQLYDYVPYVWESGHKITYRLTINTGVQLKAYISDWKEAGYTEGLILPPNNQQNQQD